MYTMAQIIRLESMRNFALFIISVGAALVIISMVSGISMLVAFSGGVLLMRTLNDIKVNLMRLAFNFVLPLIGGLLLVISGTTILNISQHTLLRRRSRNALVKATKARSLLLERVLSLDERRVIDIIRESGGEILQSNLVIRSGFSKVKVHRILKKLENRGIVMRGRLGITNSVMLSKR